MQKDQMTEFDVAAATLLRILYQVDASTLKIVADDLNGKPLAIVLVCNDPHMVSAIAAFVELLESQHPDAQEEECEHECEHALMELPAVTETSEEESIN